MVALGEGRLLSAATVGAYLAGRGLVGARDPVEAVELGGGVSNLVFAVRAPALRCVVKQALPRLRVAEEWEAKRQRAVTEGRALALAGRLLPGAVPEVLDVDEEACAVTMDRAPSQWRDWKRVLLAGAADEATARGAGEALAGWHRQTAEDAQAAEEFGDLEAFDQLRLDPYHRTVARRHPELAPAIDELLEALVSRRRCLVHGDYSPKNILVGGARLWIIDFEVAHFGNPVFDTAFMLNHLMLKAIHRPDRHDGYARCAVAFADAYRAGVAGLLDAPDADLLSHAGCLMLARVDGKSPAEYLTPPQRERARALGRELLLDPPDAVAAAWPLVRRRARG